MKLDVDYIARRQRELGLSRRDIARALNITLTRMTNLYHRNFHGTFALEQLSRLADTLTCPPGQLLRQEKSVVDTGNAESAPVAVVASLLTSANRPVSLSTLAEAIGTDLAATEATLLNLKTELERVGLTVRHNSNDGAVSIVAAAVASDEQLQTVLRGAQARQHIGTNAAALLYRIMSG